MKRILSLIMAILFLLQGFTAFGDVIFAPESEFYDQHRKECDYVDRNYYTHGEKGYIAYYKKPGGTLINYIRNAQRIRIVYTYKDWGMISYMGGYQLGTERWVKMSDLYLIYDEESFREEHADEFYKTVLELKGSELKDQNIYYYTYPGAKDPRSYTLKADETIMLLSRYIDPQGRSWGRVDYHYGIRDKWICFSDPFAVIEPFGGDPNLETFEQYSADIELPEVETEPSTDPEPETPVTNVVEPDVGNADSGVTSPDADLEEPLPNVPDTETEDTTVKVPESDSVADAPEGETEDGFAESVSNQVFLPEDPPHRVPMDPLVMVAIVLVTAAVITAAVLIIVCYKRKER